MSRQKMYKTGIFKKGKKNPRRGGDWREGRNGQGLRSMTILQSNAPAIFSTMS